jgi:glutamyl-tRNA reductase
MAWELPAADVVVGTTASQEPVVRKPEVEAAMRQRRGRPMFFLDLAVPRDVEASVADIYNVFAYELNDLESVAEENRVRRAREVPRAEAILEEELTRFLAWFGNLAVVPTLTDLRRRMEEIRDAELARLPETERQRFRQAAEAMFSKLLNELTRGLKSEEDPARKFDRVEAIRHVFGLDRGRR